MEVIYSDIKKKQKFTNCYKTAMVKRVMIKN